MQSSIPIAILVFNNLTYLRNTLNQLQKWVPANDVWIMDHGSTYPPLLEFYQSEKCSQYKVFKIPNTGPRHIFQSKILGLLPNYFAVTDPDLSLNENMPAGFLHILADLTDHFNVYKAGLALSIAPEPDFDETLTFPLTGATVREVEQGYWSDHLLLPPYLEGVPIYKAAIDTTFAVYNKKFARNGFFDSIRVAGIYTCKHLPWYKTNIVPEAEDEFYRMNTRWSSYNHNRRRG
ncbi:hypothetical protein [Baia soyae]|uniref:Glycosyl transferase family 2 n=1 Tax=Baia soyae TaxID=1544746 RepID=A0A4R2S2U5_9BACL|nr:hypothetical protein [Baia soyae]TCP70104.1 hypothetical protein EDD57_10483 [Baia soyae]